MIDSGPDYISRRLIFNLAPAHQGLYPSSRRGFPLLMFVCLSVTARKGTTFLNLLFVASTFGLKPVSSTDKRSKKSQQNSKLGTKLSLSPRYLLSSNSAEEWYMVETANPQLTSEWIKDDLMKMTFTFLQIISSDWFVRKQTKRNVKKPPSSNLL